MPAQPVGPFLPQSVEDCGVSTAAVELLSETALPATQPFRELGFSVEREKQDEGEQNR